MAFSKWRDAKKQATELDLIPVMNLFMVLIPFLLMGAAFFHVAVVPGSLPQHADTSLDAEQQETRAVTANLVLKADELELTFSGTNLDPASLEPLALSLSRGDEGFDGDAIQQRLRQAKGRYPESKTVIVLPDEDVEYQDLVGVLDLARDYRSGTDTEGEPVMEPLFPVVVFSRLLRPEDLPTPEEGGGEGGGGGEAAPAAEEG
ncbi:MAG: ExbD/TolR family protein [Sandaracinaceae bacterium]